MFIKRTKFHPETLL